MKKLMKRYGHLVGAFAMAMSTSAALTPCILIFHQPALPESVKKLRKF